ncbi:MAG: HAMP domain-containing protein [Planctomycetes bacterium]|nr:HAMP domain-containing protein [Planctomycetota bacterium]
MFLWFMALATVLVVVSGAAHLYETREALLELVDQELGRTARDLAERYAAGAPLDTTPRSPRESEPRSFEVYTIPDGVLVARSPTLGHSTQLLDATRRAALLAPRTAGDSWTEEVSALGRLRLYAMQHALAGRPAPGTGPAALLIVTSQDLKEVDDELRDVIAWTGATLAIALVLAAGAAWMAVRYLTRPLREIAEAATRIEHGNGEAIPGPGAGDEIDALAGALERAFSRLRDAYERQARFASDAAHELRTPVAAVLAQAEVATRRERTVDQYRDAMAQIVEAAQRMQQTLDALLLVARGGSDTTRVREGVADLVSVVREATASCEVLAGSRAVALHVAGPETAPLAGDPRLLGILVRNLVENAVAHSASGNSVEISVSVEPAVVTLRVRDRGDGIPADALPCVFDRFFRVDESRSRATGGSGLGLSLVRLIAELHGGTAKAESTVGVGTTMTVQLPPNAPHTGEGAVGANVRG